MTKKCIICLDDKEAEEFPVNKSHKDGLSSYCKICNTNRMKKHYKDNPEIKQKQIERSEQRRKNIQNALNTLKSNRGCSFCCENDASCLDFHHIDSNSKIESIGTLLISKSLTRIKIELLKCCVMCSNCHRKHHAGKFSIISDNQLTLIDVNAFLGQLAEQTALTS